MMNVPETACCNCTPVIETRFGWGDGRSASEAVVKAVAAAEGVTPADVPTLYETIDSDALDQLFAEQTRASEPAMLVQFSHAGWNLFIRSDGAIRVCDPNRPSEQARVFEKPLVEG